MVFQKRARKRAEFRFFIGNLIIDVVQEYTYLGNRMSSSGNFSVSCEHLKEKALHAIFSLRRHTNLRKLKPAIACKISDTMISSILTYKVKFGVCMQNQILGLGTVHKLKKHTFNFANGT